MGNMMTKDEYRELVKEQRKMLGIENIEMLSKVITDEYCSLDTYKESKVIMPYYSMDYEVNTKHLIEKAINDGKIVAVPKTYIDEIGNGYMMFVKINENTVFKKTHFGVMEPESDDIDVPEADVKIDYIMPGLAFDLRGGRIGYGRGYYDRYLMVYDRPNLHKVAFAFDFQIFDEIPSDEYDKKYDMIISENRYYFRENI